MVKRRATKKTKIHIFSTVEATQSQATNQNVYPDFAFGSRIEWLLKAFGATLLHFERRIKSNKLLPLQTLWEYQDNFSEQAIIMANPYILRLLKKMMIDAEIK